MMVYRGAVAQTRGSGLAWTADIVVARRFAQAAEELDGDGVVFRATAPPESVIAILRDRAETEIIVEPHLLRELEEIEGADKEAAQRTRERHKRVFGSSFGS
jgi:hypothetical protein